MSNNHKKPLLSVETDVSLSQKVGLVLGMISAFLVGMVIVTSFLTPSKPPEPTTVQIYYGGKLIQTVSLSSLGVNKAGEITLESVKKSNNKYFATYNQVYNGLPVYGGKVIVYINNGKVAYVKSRYYPNINISNTPNISVETAFETIKNDLNQKREPKEEHAQLENNLPDLPNENLPINEEIGLRSLTSESTLSYYDIKGEERNYDFTKISEELINKLEYKKTLIVYPKEGKYYLVWKVDLPLIKELPAQFTYFIDANNGDILGIRNNILYYNVSGNVTGLEWEDPITDNIHLEKPFAHNKITIGAQQKETDINGSYQFTGLSGNVNLISYLDGSWTKVYNDQLNESDHTASFTGETTHNWNWDTDDSSYKDEESNAFYHVNVIHDYANLLGASEMNFQMPTTVNINDTCNAYYDTTPSINFFKADTSCESTGVISDAIYHEYGHGIVHELDPALLVAGYWDQSGNIHEGLADYWACTINDNPNMAEGFYLGDPTPLRICNSDDHYPEDYNQEPHSGCQIISGAMWDIREVLGKGYLDPLLVNALRLQPINFTELLESLLVVDDDNGNLADGTPHITNICDSFLVNHGIWSNDCIGFIDIADIMPLDSEFYLYGHDYTLNVVGTVSGSGFSHYVLEWGKGENPSSWSTTGIVLANGGNQAKIRELLGTWDLPDPIGYYTLRLTAYFGDETQSDTTNINIMIMWGSGGSGNGEFNSPHGMAINGNEVFVADTYNHRIQVFDLQGNFLRKWGVEGSENGNFKYPYDIDISGNEVFVTDNFHDGFHDDRVQVFDLQGNFLRNWWQLMSPRGIDVSRNEVFVVDKSDHSVKVFDLQGNFLRKWGSGGSGDGNLKYPEGIAVSGNEVFVADRDNYRIQVFDLQGTPLRRFGSGRYGTGDGQFDLPEGIDVKGNKVFVADTYNSRIQVFDLQGNFLRKWGSEGLGAGEFDKPSGITVTTDRVYVSDKSLNRIQVFGFSSEGLECSDGTPQGQCNASHQICLNGQLYLSGDVTSDGVVNGADIAYLINYLFVGGPAPSPLEVGDVNRDGVVNPADIAYLINYLFVGGPAPCSTPPEGSPPPTEEEDYTYEKIKEMLKPYMDLEGNEL